jgi:hypothetical protein
MASEAGYKLFIWISFLLLQEEYTILSMASGILMLLVIPAIIAFVFGIWVFYSVIIDLSEREATQFTEVGPDTIRMKVDPPA